MGFCQLHIHNQIGSALDGIGRLEEYTEKAKKCNHESLACTDHGTLSAIYSNQINCIKNGIKPIIGIEAYVNNELVFMEGKKRKRTSNAHITLLAKDETGYQNLCNLNYISNKDTDHFYYSPRITENELFEYKKGVIVGSGCFNNPIAKLLREGKVEEATNKFERYCNELDDNYFVEIHLNELNYEIDELKNGQKDINDFFIHMANKKGIPIAIVGDVHFLNKGDDKLQTMAFAIRDKVSLKNLKWEIEAKNLYYHDINDYIRFNKEFGYNYNDIETWCNNTIFIADKCNYLLPQRKKINTPILSNNDDVTMILKAKEGLKRKLHKDSYEDCPDEYKKRLEEEIKILLRKGFSSYLLIVADISEFSMRENIYGRYGRGSVAGSLVCWALDISTPDPMKHGLMFQRFINQSRSPDVVLDYFCLPN